VTDIRAHRARHSGAAFRITTHRQTDRSSGLAVVARAWLVAVAVLLGAWRPVHSSEVGSPQDAYDAITELELERAAGLIANLPSDRGLGALLRARLLLYRGDCVAANTALSAQHVRALPEVAELGELARSCAGATASALVVEDRERGVWLRFQDEKDRVLTELFVQVAVRARDSLARDLAVVLPRPLRIDVVRDQFSLATVSGLPLQAAQTTGTVAVARWGRVIMVSPRAMRSGFPWQDTLAHEMTHLAISRASRDHAPLWLQEGIAKREEAAWRAPRPLDARTSYTDQARAALSSGSEVGIDRLGPSIAMLPTPEDASTAYAEVASFVEFWIRENGLPGLALLLLDLKTMKGPEDADRALRSVTGYALESWIARWKLYLSSTTGEPREAWAQDDDGKPSPDLVGAIRLGDLLVARGFAPAAAVPLAEAVRAAPELASVRARLAQALFDAGRRNEASDALGQVQELDGLHAGWLASRGRVLLSEGDREGASGAFDLALGIQPLLPEAACGNARLRESQARGVQKVQISVSDQATGSMSAASAQALCAEAEAWRRR
jgi:tetratricopeptide (TPR) repeat protein